MTVMAESPWSRLRSKVKSDPLFSAESFNVVDNIREKVSGDHNRLRADGFNLDLSYITPRIIAMGFPASGVEACYRNSLSQVSDFLRKRHGSCYAVYNLTGRSYDHSMLNDQVIDFAFPDHYPPTLHTLFRICYTMDEWLSADENNVVVVHCLAGKGRTGTVISSYLVFSGLCRDAEEAMDLFATKRSSKPADIMPSKPSQRRYVRYFCAQLDEWRRCKASGLPPPEAPKLLLKQVVFSGVPDCGDGKCSPLVQLLRSAEGTPNIEESHHLLFSSAWVKELKTYSAERVEPVVIPIGKVFEGDVLLRCFNRSSNDPLLFRVSFNTAFICITGGKDGGILHLPLSELDDIDASIFYSGENFFINLCFEPVRIAEVEEWLLSNDKPPRVVAESEDVNEICVSICREPGDALGVEVAPEASKLKILRVTEEALLWKWNQEHQHAAVSEGDYIVEVNGIRDDCQHMMTLMMQESILCLVTSKGSTCEPAGLSRPRGSRQLHNAVRWQYFFEKKETLNSMLPGWHSYDSAEAEALHASYERGDTLCRVEKSSSGYEYDLDLVRMLQINASTKKTRPMRRHCVAFRKVDIAGDSIFKASIDLAEEESMEWIYEVEDDMKLDYRVDFTPSIQDGEVQTLVNASRSAHAWSFTAPTHGRLEIQWQLGFWMTSSRVLFWDWQKHAPVLDTVRKFTGEDAASIDFLRASIADDVTSISTAASSNSTSSSPGVCQSSSGSDAAGSDLSKATGLASCSAGEASGKLMGLFAFFGEDSPKKTCPVVPEESSEDACMSEVKSLEKHDTGADADSSGITQCEIMDHDVTPKFQPKPRASVSSLVDHGSVRKAVEQFGPAVQDRRPSWGDDSVESPEDVAGRQRSVSSLVDLGSVRKAAEHFEEIMPAAVQEGYGPSRRSSTHTSPRRQDPPSPESSQGAAAKDPSAS